MLLDLVFLIFGLAFFGLALFGFFWQISQASKDRAAKREISLRFYPDQNGNYPQAIYNDGYTNFPPGNAGKVDYLIQPVRSDVMQLIPARPETKLQVYGSEVTEVNPPQLPQSQQEVIEVLTDAKNRGLTKTQALALLGITGGNSFKKYGKKFDDLP